MRNENVSNTATILQGQEILALQDELTGALIGLARSCGNNPKTIQMRSSLKVLCIQSRTVTLV